MTAVSPYLPGKDLPTAAAATTDDLGLLPGPYALRDRIVELQAAGQATTQLLLVDVWSADELDPAVRTELTAVVASCLRGSDWLAGDGPVRFGVLAAGSPADAEVVAVRVVGAVTAAVPGAQAVAGIAGVHTGATATEVHARAVRALDRAHDLGVGAIVHDRTTP